MKNSGNYNYYIANVKEIARVAYRHDRAWNVAIDLFDALHPDDGCAVVDVGAQRAEFYDYVKGRVYDRDGNEVTE